MDGIINCYYKDYTIIFNFDNHTISRSPENIPCEVLEHFSELDDYTLVLDLFNAWGDFVKGTSIDGRDGIKELNLLANKYKLRFGNSRDIWLK